MPSSTTSCRGPKGSIPHRPWRFTLGPVVLLLALTSRITADAGGKVDSRPNIVFVLADDYGFHDIGYHGSRIRTPNLDRLAGEGVKLENYYVQPICTPTRSQLMSGRYQIHTGLQHGIIRPKQPNGLPLNSSTLARVLKNAGYSTHMVGKWHLGFYKSAYLPTNRGFDSYYGYLTGSENYFTHKRSGFIDLHDNLKPVFNETGHYSAHLFTQKASDVINAHDPQKGPLFLYLAYQSVHGPLQVPDRYLQQYQDIKDKNRRTYAGMVTCMDEGIGNLTALLKNKGLWDNTVFVFSTDNGGQVFEGGNNFPLRGWKGSLWEGGLHGVGFVHSQLLRKPGSVSKELIHVTDWFPTLARLANASLNGTLPLDGFDQWATISENAPSPRKELLHNIDPLYSPSGSPIYPNTFDSSVRAAIRVGDYKLITGNPGKGSWIPPPELLQNLPLTKTSYQGQGHGQGQSSTLFFRTEEKSHPGDFNDDYDYDGDAAGRWDPSAKNVWLFNITADPQERHDLSDSKPEVVKMMLERLKYYQSTAVPARFPKPDPNSNPAKHGGVWGPWM